MGIIDFLFKKEEKKKRPSNKIKTIDGVDYNFIKNKKSKSIRITVKDRYNVKITLPFSCPYKIAENFADKKQDWIKEQLNKFDFFQIDETYKTKTNNLIISTGFVQKPVIRQTKGIVQFIYPIGSDFYSKEIQEKAKLAIKKALRLEAENYLPKRLAELALKFGFKYNKIALKNHKTRWGSCSYNNNINLNINLMNLDKEFIDYVLIHELCHTIEKNHREGFWKLVQKCMPEAQKIRQELKKQKPVI